MYPAVQRGIQRSRDASSSAERYPAVQRGFQWCREVSSGADRYPAVQRDILRSREAFSGAKRYPDFYSVHRVVGIGVVEASFSPFTGPF